MTPESKGKLLAMAINDFAVLEALIEINRLTRELALARIGLAENLQPKLEAENERLRKALTQVANCSNPDICVICRRAMREALQPAKEKA